MCIEVRIDRMLGLQPTEQEGYPRLACARRLRVRDDERSHKCNNIGVGYVKLSELQVFGDGKRQLLIWLELSDRYPR
jgi:hypothetical protein